MLKHRISYTVYGGIDDTGILCYSILHASNGYVMAVNWLGYVAHDCGLYVLGTVYWSLCEVMCNALEFKLCFMLVLMPSAVCRAVLYVLPVQLSD